MPDDRYALPHRENDLRRVLSGVHRRVPHPLKAVTRLARPFLHAERLVITHPRTRERMEFTAPIPADLEAIAYELAPPEIRETVFARVSIAEETHHDLDEDEDVR